MKVERTHSTKSTPSANFFLKPQTIFFLSHMQLISSRNDYKLNFSFWNLLQWHSSFYQLKWKNLWDYSRLKLKKSSDAEGRLKCVFLGHGMRFQVSQIRFLINCYTFDLVHAARLWSLLSPFVTEIYGFSNTIIFSRNVLLTFASPAKAFVLIELFNLYNNLQYGEFLFSSVIIIKTKFT